MKNKILLLLFLVSSACSFSGCLKRGENDPEISLRTRNARLTGEWKLVKYNETYNRNGNTPADPQHRSFYFDGEILTETFDGKYVISDPNLGLIYIDTSFTNRYVHALKLNIEKNGMYYYEETTDGVTMVIANPMWEWENSDPKQTRIKFSSWRTMNINRLANKEIIFEYNYSGEVVNGAFSYQENYEASYTFNKNR